MQYKSHTQHKPHDVMQDIIHEVIDESDNESIDNNHDGVRKYSPCNTPRADTSNQPYVPHHHKQQGHRTPYYNHSRTNNTIIHTNPQKIIPIAYIV